MSTPVAAIRLSEIGPIPSEDAATYFCAIACLRQDAALLRGMNEAQRQGVNRGLFLHLMNQACLSTLERKDMSTWACDIAARESVDIRHVFQ